MSNSFTIKVFFRGDWCPWCNAYLRDFNSQLDTVGKLGGQIIGITSQANNQSVENNNLNFKVLVDEGNTEARKYDIAVTAKEDSPLKGVPDVYPNGMVQPGVVIEDADSKVLYRWAIVPSEMNFNGAMDRPLVSDVIDALQHILENGSTPGEFRSTDMAYLEAGHPEIHKGVLEFLSKNR